MVVKSPIAHKNFDKDEARVRCIHECQVEFYDRARETCGAEVTQRARDECTLEIDKRARDEAVRIRDALTRPTRLGAARENADEGTPCSERDVEDSRVFEKRMEALEEWTRVHEDLAKDLESWPGSTDRVGVVRYERLEATCACEGIIDFVVPPWSRTDAAVPPASGLSPLSRRPKERTVS